MIIITGVNYVVVLLKFYPEDFPNGSWLGDENNPFKRVRVCIPQR